MTTTTDIHRAFVELDESGSRIEVYFKFDRDIKDRVKAIPARFVGHDKNPEHGPHWTVAATLENARELREIFGEGLQLGDAVKAWGKKEVARLGNVGKADIPVESLALYAEHNELATWLRTYQKADVAHMATQNVLNTNQPGTGKTIEVLAAIEEAGLLRGAHLISAPVRSLENVWRLEIERWMPGKVYTSESRKERVEAIREGLAAAAKGETVWICVNPDMLRAKRLRDDDSTTPVIHSDHKGRHYGARDDLHAAILAVNWQSFTIDEFHKAGLNEAMTLATIGTDRIKSERRYLLSGTPMGGKPIKLFAPLRSIAPQQFSSKWRWANKWLVVETNRWGKTIGGIKPGLEEKFYDAHAPYMIRRLKRDALPGLPKIVRNVVPCEMTASQARQYAKFQKDSEVRIADAAGESTMVQATCVLAEFARAKQFANALCRLDAQGCVIPTTDSGKLPQLLEKLDEFGIRTVDPEPGARALVASQSSRMVEMVSEWLTEQGIANDTLTGDTKDSTGMIKRFQGDDPTPYVIVMTTQTGGVSLNLERTSSVHILDESWNPDDEEQLEDRGDRGSRTTPLVALYYRTTGTVQEYIAEVARDKRVTNKNVLDLYRQIKERTQ